MEQQRAINALESYIVLSKDAKSPRAAADLVLRATADPNTYVFAELLHMPNIYALRQTEDYANHYRHLEIFAWGTWVDYHSTPNLPALTPQHEQKLRLLSLLPLARDQTKLSYASLQSALSLPSPQALESLVTTAIYAGLITGTIDPAHKVITLTSVAALRDLPPGSLPSLISALETWSRQCSGMLGELDGKMLAIRTEARSKGERRERVRRLVEEKVAGSEEGKGKGKRGAAAGGDRDEEGDSEMLDEGVERTRGGRPARKMGAGAR